MHDDFTGMHRVFSNAYVYYPGPLSRRALLTACAYSMPRQSPLSLAFYHTIILPGNKFTEHFMASYFPNTMLHGAKSLPCNELCIYSRRNLKQLLQHNAQTADDPCSSSSRTRRPA